MLSDLEKPVRKSLKNIVANCLDNHKNDSCRELVRMLLSAYQVLCCNMSLKINFFRFRAGFFSENLGAENDE